MSRLLAVTLSLGLAFTLGACATPADGGNTQSSANPTPTPDQALVPKSPTTPLAEVDPELYNDGFDWYTFRAGDGPTWCTFTPESDRVLCEQNEAAAQYLPIPPAEGCQGSYGYQVELYASKPAESEIAGFPCASGQFQDPTNALLLPSGSKITVGSISCFVEDVTARCENTTGQWIALGPKVWSLNY